MAVNSSVAVYSAIVGNSLVMMAKFGAFIFTGSSAMLSEAIHSLADVANQCLLALGIRSSGRRPNVRHPYGFSRERYIWALISAVGIFFLGCGVTVYHGIHVLLHPHEITDIRLAIFTLLFALVIEGASLGIAIRAILLDARKHQMSVREYFSQSGDPMGIAVFLEDGAAVTGVLIAGAGLTLSHITDNPMWDGVATLAIGILMGLVACFLVYKTRGLLIGQAIPRASHQKILQILKNDPIVEYIYDVKSAVLGPGDLRFTAEIEFNGEILAERFLEKVGKRDSEKALEVMQGDREAIKAFLKEYSDHLIEWLGDEIDRLESQIRQALPEVKYVDIEPN